MSCRQYEAELLDEARDVPDRRGRSEAFREHLLQCEPCAARLRRERVVTEHLAALRSATAAACPSADLEQRLLRAVATGGEVDAGVSRQLRWLAAAAVLVLSAGVAIWLGLASSGAGTAGDRAANGPTALGTGPNQRVANGPTASGSAGPNLESAPAIDGHRLVAGAVKGGPGRRGRALPRPAPRPSDAAADFVAWPGAAALPAFESGELVRAEVPASVLPLLGISRAEVSERGTVMADFIVGQDGMARAVRLVR